MSPGEILTLTDLHPLIIQINPVEATIEGIEKSFADADAIYARGDKIAWLSCLPAGVKLNTAPNRLAGRLIKERESTIRKQAVGIGFLSDSLFFSFVISTLLMVQPMPMPYKASADARELLIWLGLLFRKAGIELGPDTAQRALALIAEQKTANAQANATAPAQSRT